ncbi:murein biosynthesis integral membrane protein MurJ [Corynebacterium deserti]|nr:murein biosynthesis integral membrane protein MurJ [Corynebacterium deserti]
MAIATLLSRITGFLRTVMIGAALSPAIASAFNTANTLPNLITEIVLGAVLTSLVIPVLTRAEKEDADGGSGFFRRLLTLCVTLLGGVTILSVIAAPALTRMMLSSEGQVNVVMSTAFAYWLLPQIFFYGLFSLFMAVLNTREIFKPGAWAPVVNNVITLAVLGIYMILPARLHPQQHVSIIDPQIVFLGLGTTLGVVAQCLIMVPYLRRAGIDMRPLWGIDARLKQFGGMAMAIVVYVAVSQFGYVITTRIASLADEAAPFIYQQHWMLLQVPYGIIGVTLLTAIMPRLSRNAAEGDDRAVVSDLQLGSKLTFIALIPIVVFFTAFGVPIANALFAYGQFDSNAANILGWTLSFSAFTLIPYALVLLHLRVFYAREEAWTPTFIIAGITATKVVLSLLAPVLSSSPERVVVLLGAANGFSFITGAVIGVYLLRKKLGLLGLKSLAKTSLWALGSAAVGAAAAWALGWLIEAVIGDFLLGTLGSIGYLIYLGILGVFFIIVTGIVLSRSGLPEVQNLGQALTRIPGMGRFIHPNDKISLDVGEVSEQDFSTQLVAPSEFAATPVPPPMSAGIVRGPRLVPGAPVGDGRFRLLADHGGVQGARFWQAREIETGKEVALVFVDTSGNAPFAPLSTAAAAGIAYEVQRRTKKLASLNSAAIASNIRTEAYRNGCLIVADWVPGSSLAAVAEDGADPRAAAYALAELTEATGAAHEKGIPLGLDNKCRIRINTDGHAVLAFPAILPESTMQRDAKSLASAAEMLIDASVAPTDVKEMITQAKALATEEDPDYGSLAIAMRTCGLFTEEPAHLVVKKEKTPRPDKRPGFGASDYSVKGMAAIAIVVIILVSLVAAVTAFLTSFFGGNNEESPLATVETTTSAEPTEPQGPPVYLPLADAVTWDEGAGEDVGAVTDGDTATAWTSTGSAGLLVHLADPALLDRIILTTGDGADTSVTSSVKIYAFNNANPRSLSEGIEIGTVDYSGRSLSHSIRDSSKLPGQVESVVILVDEVRSSNASATTPEMQIAEVELIGW